MSERADTIRISIPLDVDGFLDRECPVESCLGFFKVMLGTGLPEIETCGCPYCGHRAAHNEFGTPAQNDYIQAMTTRHVATMIGNEIEDAARGFRSSLAKLTISKDTLESVIYPHVLVATKFVCSACGCMFKVHGHSGLCPDCGKQNGISEG